eukprot:evm.model.scf_448.3 EVM.evm.TU.scf_448.3   scf_448:54917-58250(-)
MAWLLRFHDAWALRPLLLLGAVSAAALGPCARGISAASRRLATRPRKPTRGADRDPCVAVEALPREVLLMVFARLDCRSLALASCACRAWRAASLEDSLWMGLVGLEFGQEALDRRDARRAPTWRLWLTSLATSPAFAHAAQLQRFRSSLDKVRGWQLVVEQEAEQGGREQDLCHQLPKLREKVNAFCGPRDALAAPQGVILGFVLPGFNPDASLWNLSVVADCGGGVGGRGGGVEAWSRRLVAFPKGARCGEQDDLLGMYPDLTVGRVGAALSVTVRLHYRDVLEACRGVVAIPQTLPLVGGKDDGPGEGRGAQGLDALLLHVDVSTLAFDGALVLSEIERSFSHRARLTPCDRTDKAVIFAGVLPGACALDPAPEHGPRASVLLDMAVFGENGSLVMGLSGLQLAIIDCGREGEYVAIAFHIANGEGGDGGAEGHGWSDESKLMMRALRKGDGLVTLFYLKLSSEVCREVGRDFGRGGRAGGSCASEEEFETDWSRLLIRTL